MSPENLLRSRQERLLLIEGASASPPPRPVNATPPSNSDAAALTELLLSRKTSVAGLTSIDVTRKSRPIPSTACSLALTRDASLETEGLAISAAALSRAAHSLKTPVFPVSGVDSG